MRTVFVPRARLGMPRSKRVLALAGDERLVEHIRRGDELAFEVAFERHSPAILSFCRHMLGSHEEAEDAVQQAFASAFRDLLRDDRAINLKPWLFTIARNRCLSMLRARRDHVPSKQDIPTAGLAEEVEWRGELRNLLRDLNDLPEQQRGALLMSELSGLTHAEIGGVLDCEPQKVKALVFRARSGLIERRDAREAPCHEIREELANLRGGSLRRGRLRHHLRVCDGCREYRDQLNHQRSMLAAVLPVVPSLGLKQSVLGAIGVGGGSAGGGGLLGGLGAAATGQVGSATLAKLAIIGVLAGGGAVAGDAVVEGPGAGPRDNRPEAGQPVAAPDGATLGSLGGEREAVAGPGDRVPGTAGSRDEAKSRGHRGRGRGSHAAKPAEGESSHRGPSATGKALGSERGHGRAAPGGRAQGRGKAGGSSEQATRPKAVKERPQPPGRAPKPERKATAQGPGATPSKLPKFTTDERAAATSD
jgi:RNA polymerase sigma factor (sigma-70 family)